MREQGSEDLKTRVGVCAIWLNLIALFTIMPGQVWERQGEEKAIASQFAIEVARVTDCPYPYSLNFLFDREKFYPERL